MYWPDLQWRTVFLESKAPRVITLLSGRLVTVVISTIFRVIAEWSQYDYLRSPCLLLPCCPPWKIHTHVTSCNLILHRALLLNQHDLERYSYRKVSSRWKLILLSFVVFTAEVSETEITIIRKPESDNRINDATDQLINFFLYPVLSPGSVLHMALWYNLDSFLFYIFLLHYIMLLPPRVLTFKLLHEHELGLGLPFLSLSEYQRLRNRSQSNIDYIPRLKSI